MPMYTGGNHHSNLHFELIYTVLLDGLVLLNNSQIRNDTCVKTQSLTGKETSLLIITKLPITGKSACGLTFIRELGGGASLIISWVAYVQDGAYFWCSKFWISMSDYF